MWSTSENRFVAFADRATLFVSAPSLHMRPFVAESLNRDLAKISAWCKLRGRKMKMTKTQCMTVSTSKTVFPPYPDLFIDDVPLTLCDSFTILGVISVEEKKKKKKNSMHNSK